jgi:hypothetical protein
MKYSDAAILAKSKGNNKPSAARIHKAAINLGSLGGLARADALSDKRRSEIARKAANIRWGNIQMRMI